MGLVDIIIPALCFNLTCFDDLDVGKMRCGSVKEYLRLMACFITEPVCFNIPCPPEGEEFEIYRKSRVEFSQLKLQLEEEQLRVTTINNGGLSGYTRPISTSNGTIVNGTGVAFELLNILRDKYKFNYTVIKPDENMWGSDKIGALGMMVKNKVDLTVAFLPVLADFFNHTSYSPSLDMGIWVAMMKRPTESATGSGLLAPFTLPVWMLILLSLFVVGPVIHLLIRLKAMLCKEDNDTIYNVSSCMWFVYGALLKQGTTLNPVTDSSRILFATWWIFITILTAFYTANLTAFLTLSKFTLPINQAADIGKKHYSWVSNEGNGLRDIIASENNVPAEYRALSLGAVVGNPLKWSSGLDADILTEYVDQRNMIFIREKPLVEYAMYDDYKEKVKANVTEEDRCTYVVTKFNITAYPRAFAYAKDFKYKKVFDSAIQHLVEAGIVKFQLNLQLPDTQICPLDLGSKERQLRNSDLSLTYVIVGIGFAIAAAVFVVELGIKHLILKEPGAQQRIRLFERRPKKSKHDQHLGFGRWKEPHFASNFKTPPPPYHSLFMQHNTKRTIVNGREYWLDESGNESRLVPVRTPSALLFQYTN